MRFWEKKSEPSAGARPAVTGTQPASAGPLYLIPTQQAASRQTHYFRFATEPPRRHWRQQAVLTLALLFTLLGLAPLRGGDVELKLPVSYARVKLPARAPIVVSLDLPPGEYNVEPKSLGYFKGNSEFVYTADEPRGLIYARSGDRVVVVELQAPAQAAEFMADYLHRIREAVTNLNARENELLQARQAYAAASGRAKQLASIPLSMDSVDLAEGFDDWCARCADEGPQMVGAAQGAIGQSASERNELKRRYYAAQEAEMELQLRSFDLQIALARLPQPGFAAVLGGTGSEAIRAKTLNSLQARKRSWESRRNTLLAQQRMDMQWLSSPSSPALAATLSAGATPVGGAAPFDDTLRQGIQQARMQLSGAELSYLDAALAAVNSDIDYVTKGGLVDPTALPRLALDPAQLTDVRVSDLADLTLVESSALKPSPAAGVLLNLAKLFEHPESPAPLQLPSASGIAKVDCFPQELAYGLLVVDRCERNVVRRQEQQTGPPLDARLGTILANPAQYDAEGNDLGYLAFMRWYAKECGGPADKLAGGIAQTGKAVGE